MGQRFTTDRSAFERTVSTEWFKCSGCERGIGVGQPMLERDYVKRGKVTGKTRLHDRDDCFETWELRVLERIAEKRKNQQWK